MRTRNSVHVFRNLSRPDRFSAVLNKRASDVQEGRIAKTCISFAIGKSPAPYVEKKRTPQTLNETKLNDRKKRSFFYAKKFRIIILN
ncbi:MAG: hypothetical protein L6V79_00255 [Clostridium sp.]|nr:MAG: hypothetical protein L6V79_00255 [Clostridium sp.]